MCGKRYGMDAIGIGKIMLESLNTDSYNIPHLHFIFIRTGEFIEAVNLEFGLVASDVSADTAVKDLVTMLIEYIKRTLETMPYKTFRDIVSSTAMDEYWREYRVLEFELAEQKKDLGNNFVTKLKAHIVRDIMKSYGVKPTAKYSVLRAA